MGLLAYLMAKWNFLFSVVASMRKESTNNCRPISIGMTDGGYFRYGTGIGASLFGSMFRGGHSAGSLIPL